MTTLEWSMDSQQARPRFLTWLDVERHLKKVMRCDNVPADLGLLSVDCFFSGMDVRHTGEQAAVERWLKDVFRLAYEQNQDWQGVRLSIGKTRYEVVFERVDASQAVSEIILKNPLPLWRDVAYLPDQDLQAFDRGTAKSKETMQAFHSPAFGENGPMLVAFHSFKGGVGRTSAMMTYVSACLSDRLKKPHKVLVIDGDFEAPGVTFWLKEVSQPQVSFVQLLEALHYPPESVDSTLDYFAEKLRQSTITIAGLERELMVLPAALNLLEIQDMRVAPEHLVRDPQNPWVLSDHLHALGKRLGVDAVFVDLRAGLSELASPLLFDPRVDHFLVTTVAPQSVIGMAEELRRLHAFNARLPEDVRIKARPTVVLSLLTKDLKDAGRVSEAVEQLERAYPLYKTLSSDGTSFLESEVDSELMWQEVGFMPQLMVVDSIREALESFAGSDLFPVALEWAQSLGETQTPSVGADSLQVGDMYSAEQKREAHQAKARRLKKVCAQAEFAEGESVEEMPILPIDPLLTLGRHFLKEVPNALVVGVKGAGKTFTARQIVCAKQWALFLEKISFKPHDVRDAHIFPVLWSRNIEDTPNGEIKQAQRAVLMHLRSVSGTHVEDSLLVRSALDERLTQALATSETSWLSFWEALVLEQLGWLGDMTSFSAYLHESSRRVVLVFDGIEDAFEDVENVAHQEAIRALLSLPGRLKELAEGCLGALVFVRQDYLRAVVKQNVAQLESRYEPYRLHWNPQSFLQLAFLLAEKAGLYDYPDLVPRNQVLQLGGDALKEKLERLWGKKLGSEASKEAHSARWVYSALCDLKGQIQARDLVRFLKIAAEFESARSGPYREGRDERLLSPEAIRKALPKCSTQKIEEAKQEIRPLRDWVDILKGVSSARQVPFAPEEVGLGGDKQLLLQALEALGVVYEDKDQKQKDGGLSVKRYFLPEIYREGLGFTSLATGRPRVQALLKKNLGVIPL